MSFYEYYMLRAYGRIQRVQQDFALAYLFGRTSGMKAADAPGRKDDVPEMNTIEDIVAAEQAAKDAHPGMDLDPKGFRLAGDVASGARTVSEYLVGLPRRIDTFDDVMDTVRFAIRHGS